MVLSGSRIHLGFHFEPRRNGRLRQFEVFRIEARDLRESYDEFQRHLELTLGPPLRRTDDPETGFASHEWKQGHCRVLHYVMERFGPEEHVRFVG